MSNAFARKGPRFLRFSPGFGRATRSRLEWSQMLAALLLLLVPQVVLPRPQDLQAAAHDDVELGRLGCRLGPARLLRLAEAGRGGQRAVALRALSLCGEGDSLVATQALPPLADLIGRAGDEKLLQAAARAALQLGQRLGRDLLDGEEIGGDELPRAAAQLLRLAGDRALPSELRAELVLAATALPRPLWTTGAALGTLGGLGRSPEGPVRQAALAALTSGGAAGEAELQRLAAEADGDVAVSAAAALCQADAVPSPLLAEQVRRLAAAPPAAVTEAAAPTLAPTPITTLEQRQRLLPCLRRLGTPADRALASQLGRKRGGR